MHQIFEKIFFLPNNTFLSARYLSCILWNIASFEMQALKMMPFFETVEFEFEWVKNTKLNWTVKLYDYRVANMRCIVWKKNDDFLNVSLILHWKYRIWFSNHRLFYHIIRYLILKKNPNDSSYELDKTAN